VTVLFFSKRESFKIAMALKTKPSYKVSTKSPNHNRKTKTKNKKQRTRKLEQHGIPHGDDAGSLLVLVLPLA
jgi:hypothetical protein